MKPKRIVIPLPFALREANAWFFPGARPALVDCGIRTPEGYGALMAGLGPLDCGLDLHVTHGHVDHAGNAARLCSEHGAVLHAVPEESPVLESFCACAPSRNDAYAEAMRVHGVPDEVIQAADHRGRGMDDLTQDVAIQVRLSDGERVALGDTSARIHLAPGHTPGSVMYETEANQLVTGDTLLEHITSNAMELRDADRGRYARYLQTLSGLERFVGCEVLPGHHAPFMLTHAVLEHHLAKHARRRAKILASLTQPKTAYQLMHEVLPHMDPQQLFLGLCEMVGHLHALEDEGRIRLLEGSTRQYVV